MKERELQNYEKWDKEVEEEFLKKFERQRIGEKIKFSWSNWGFGQEPLEKSLNRLKEAGVDYIELHGNLYGEDLGYNASEVDTKIKNQGLEVSGICGMYTPYIDLASEKGWIRQNAIDYMKRNISLGYELDAEYFIIAPTAVGKPESVDEYERTRSIQTLSKVADELKQANLKGAIEPIRAAEVSFCHTFEDANSYINDLGHPAVQWINGDIYHMMQEESHIGKTLVKYGDKMVNLHLADTNRRALGTGMINLDVVIMALFLLNYHKKKRFVTAEPLGPGSDPYPARYKKHDDDQLNNLVNNTVKYFRKRESIVKDMVFGVNE